jgi:hypothetical protein
MIARSAAKKPLPSDAKRWNALSPREKLEEFNELVRSPYWHFLPDEIKSTIRSMLAC